MYVWRLPLIHLAALMAFVAVAVTWEVVAWLRRRFRSELAGRLALSCGALVALLSPGIVHLVVERELRELASHGMYADPGAVFYAGPAIAAALLFVVSRWAIPSTEPGVGRARCVFWMTAFALAIANLANGCSPGWCERYGFPLSYRWWSDSIVVMNGVNLSAGASRLAACIDAIAIGAAALLAARMTLRNTRDSE